MVMKIMHVYTKKREISQNPGKGKSNYPTNQPTYANDIHQKIFKITEEPQKKRERKKKPPANKY
jgi:hypothetical protein